MNKLDMNLFAFVAWLEMNRHAHSENRLTINDGYEWYNYMWNQWLKNSDAGRGMMMNKKTFEEAAKFKNRQIGAAGFVANKIMKN